MLLSLSQYSGQNQSSYRVDTCRTGQPILRGRPGPADRPYSRSLAAHILRARGRNDKAGLTFAILVRDIRTTHRYAGTHQAYNRSYAGWTFRCCPPLPFARNLRLLEVGLSQPPIQLDRLQGFTGPRQLNHFWAKPSAKGCIPMADHLTKINQILLDVIQALDIPFGA